MNTPIPLIVLSKSDIFPEKEIVYCGEECDCACPDNGFSFEISASNKDGRLVQSKLYSAQLDENYDLFFNPANDAGVVVMNVEAVKLLQLFKIPTTIDTISLRNEKKIAISQMISFGILETEGNQTQAKKSTPRTLSAWLHVTNECNLRCSYCYINKTPEKMERNVGFDSIDAIFRSATKGGFKRVKIKYAGGEATLNLHLVFELNEYAKNKSSQLGLEFESSVLSNGVVLSEINIKNMIEQNIRLMISLDGVGDAHDAQRKFINGKGSFDWVNRTLNKSLALGLRPFISITITDLNVDSLSETVRYVLSKGLPFNINFYRETECALQSEDLKMRDDKIILSIKEAFKVIEENLPSYSLMGMLIDRSSFDQAHEKTCGVGESYMVIDQNGHIAKCHMEIEKPITTIYEEDPLSFIKLDSIGIQNISVEEKEGCRECEWRYWCAGGCPLLTYKSTGRYDVKSPYCRVYKAIYPELLRLEALRLMKYTKPQNLHMERIML